MPLAALDDGSHDSLRARLLAQRSHLAFYESDAELTDELCDRIRRTIRDEVSPRHVPDDILVAPGVPHTRTGKKLEVPIKKLLQGADPGRIVERSAVDDPALLDWYAKLRR